MTCEEFKNRIADLFDKDVEPDAAELLYEHMDICPECREYYNNFADTIGVLMPKLYGECCIGKKKRHAFAKQKTIRIAGIAAAFALGMLLGWSHLFTAEATATVTDNFSINDALNSVRNVGSCSVEMFVRASATENFASIDPAADFIAVSMKTLRVGDSLYWRVERQGGRTVVFDGKEQYMWYRGRQMMKGGHDTDFLEYFKILLYPDQLLNTQKAMLGKYPDSKHKTSENDTVITMTTEIDVPDGDLMSLFRTGKAEKVHVIIENLFTKNDRLLRRVRVWIMQNGRRILVAKSGKIEYNLMLSKAQLIALPTTDAARWRRVDSIPQVYSPRVKALQVETATQAARRIIGALIKGDTNIAHEALYYYQSQLDRLKEYYRNTHAEAFSEPKRDGDYAGVYVFYKFTDRKGKTTVEHIALRCDNPQHIWIADGGL